MSEATPFQTPNLSVDTVLCTIVDGALHVLLIQIASEMYQDYWALPGGLVQYNEPLADAARRTLLSKAHADDIPMQQLHAFDRLDRDPRSRTISIAYLALIHDKDERSIKVGDYYKAISWYPVAKLPELIAFDHREIIGYAHSTLKKLILYSDVSKNLLPSEFTLTQLQYIHEAILGEKLDRRNFRKKFLSTDLIEKTDAIEINAAHRPAALYRFVRKTT